MFGGIISGVTTSTHTHILCNVVVCHTLLTRWTSLGRAATWRFDLRASFPCRITLKSRGTFALVVTRFVLANGPSATWVVGALIQICTSIHTVGIAGVALTAETLGLPIDQLTLGIGTTSHIFTWI